MTKATKKPKPAKYLKSEISEGNYMEYIRFCESVNLPYTLTETNYTVTITSEFCNVKFSPTMDKKAFIAGAMVKRDIKRTGLEPPDLIQRELTYFEFAPDEVLNAKHELIYNIDIKSAYATVLLNHSLITQKTFEYMKRLSKKNRLACVGMLASKKEHYDMIGRETVGKRTEISDNANWFFFCVNRTSEIMMKCKELAGGSFLFFWVDGVFISDYSKVKLITDYLRSINYLYSFDRCENLTYNESESVKTLTYTKGLSLIHI